MKCQPFFKKKVAFFMHETFLISQYRATDAGDQTVGEGPWAGGQQLVPDEQKPSTNLWTDSILRDQCARIVYL